MANPSNMSLDGIVKWAEAAGSPAGSPPNTGNAINADRLDGYHYSQLKSEWEAFASTAGGGGVVAMGSANFAGNGSYRTVTFTPALPASYAVYIIPDAATGSYAGEYWVSNKTNSSFRVYNAGSATTSFQWAVAVMGQMPDLAGPASGDISGTHPGPYTVTRMQGRNISSTAPSTGQVLTWNGSSWAPAAASSGSGNVVSAGSVIAVGHASPGTGNMGVIGGVYTSPGWGTPNVYGTPVSGYTSLGIPQTGAGYIMSTNSAVTAFSVGIILFGQSYQAGTSIGVGGVYHSSTTSVSYGWPSIPAVRVPTAYFSSSIKSGQGPSNFIVVLRGISF